MPGFPESHGCVHLPIGFARALFGITKLGATVVVQGSAVDHIRTTDSSLLLPLNLRGEQVSQRELDATEYRWTPAASLTGPLTIIVSKRDQRIVVLRNGIEIGRSAAIINDDDPGSHVISLTVGKDGKASWIYVGLPGHSEDEGRELDEATINRLRLPRAFYEAVKAELRPGTTILVTQSSVGNESGERVTIMDSVVPRM